MSDTVRHLSELPTQTRECIGSSISISSLVDVILELVKNSLDAGAEQIRIHLDFRKGYCSVTDDGHGIMQDEFLDDGGLGRLYFTSKHGLNHLYGRYGRFLASLSGVSLLSVTSRSSIGESTSRVVFQNGKRITTTTDVQDETIHPFKHGTRVVVHNLFGNLPVRTRHIASSFDSATQLTKTFFILKKALVGMILGHKRLFVLDVNDGVHVYHHKPRTKWSGLGVTASPDFTLSTLFQAGLIERSDPNDWRQVFARSSTMMITAIICTRPAATKAVQFVSINNRPLPVEMMYDVTEQWNVLFSKSSFGKMPKTREDVSRESARASENKRESATKRQEVDRWPMFSIQVELVDNHSELLSACVTSIQGMLYALAKEFLHTNGFSLEGRSQSDCGQCSTTTTVKSSGFIDRSRIRSGIGLPTDLHSGLPFMTPIREDDSSNGHTMSPNSRDTLEWVNPRTSNVVQINPLTGMSLPAPHVPTIKSQHPPRLRKLCDVVNTLKDYTPPIQISKKTAHISMRTLDVCSPILLQESPLGLSDSQVTKDDLKRAIVLGQVDKKFILASIPANYTTLVLIDQHAADERIKVEDLFRQLHASSALNLPTPIILEVSKQESQHLWALQNDLRSWQIHYTVSDTQIQVSALPGLIAERCRLDPDLLISILRNEIWQDRKGSFKGSDWLSCISACPQGILDLLISRACRSAIMFNDVLSLEQCRDLVQNLCNCTFPFQCAHGRPSLTVLAHLGDPSLTQEDQRSNFGNGWKAW